MAKTMNNQHSANKEVLSAIQRLSSRTDKAIQALSDRTDKRFSEVFEVLTFIKDNVPMRDEILAKEEAVTKEEFNREISGIKVMMVTKDYLDGKLADLRGDLVVLMRKGDTKLKALVGILHGKKVISNTDVKKIYSMEPFAQ